ncbi:MAG: TIGR03085 family metal-binding protein [Actinomycetota bacterium]|nr:TIGR03085 family metal-binding protein [Actinomycetota bacterium]
MAAQSRSTLSRRERSALCDLMDEVGPDAATLCEGWTTRDLAAHLVLREGSPLAVAGIAFPPLERLTNRGMDRLSARVPYPTLVERVRQGPPLLSPFRPAQVDRMANAVEYFVHHEDVLRAQPGGPRREIEPRDQDSLWGRVGALGKLLARRATVGIELVRSDTGQVRRIRSAEPTLVARGLPGELVMFAYGRGAHTDVEVQGDEAARDAFEHSHLGL